MRKLRLLLCMFLLSIFSMSTVYGKTCDLTSSAEYQDILQLQTDIDKKLVDLLVKEEGLLPEEYHYELHPENFVKIYVDSGIELVGDSGQIMETLSNSNYVWVDSEIVGDKCIQITVARDLKSGDWKLTEIGIPEVMAYQQQIEEIAKAFAQSDIYLAGGVSELRMPVAIVLVSEKPAAIVDLGYSKPILEELLGDSMETSTANMPMENAYDYEMVMEAIQKAINSDQGNSDVSGGPGVTNKQTDESGSKIIASGIGLLVVAVLSIVVCKCKKRKA